MKYLKTFESNSELSIDDYYRIYLDQSTKIKNDLETQIKEFFFLKFRPSLELIEEIDHILMIRFGDEGINHKFNLYLSNHPQTKVVFNHQISELNGLISLENLLWQNGVDGILDNAFRFWKRDVVKIVGSRGHTHHIYDSSSHHKIMIDWLKNTKSVVVNMNLFFYDENDKEFGPGCPLKNLDLLLEELKNRFPFLEFDYNIYSHKSKRNIFRFQAVDNDRVPRMDIAFFMGDLN